MNETKAIYSEFVEVVTSYGEWLGFKVSIDYPNGEDSCWMTFAREGIETHGGIRGEAVRAFGSGKYGTNTRAEDVDKFALGFVEDACRTVWTHIKKQRAEVVEG